jgi:hypothetical protein
MGKGLVGTPEGETAVGNLQISGRMFENGL